MNTIQHALGAIVLVGLLAGTTGCAYKYTYQTGKPKSDEVVKEWRHITSWGWSTQRPVDLEAMCPAGVAEFGSYMSFPNWLCALGTAGFYSPRTVYAYPASKEVLK
jgi:hypothetical protein